jgi:hypothetical protein
VAALRFGARRPTFYPCMHGADAEQGDEGTISGAQLAKAQRTEADRTRRLGLSCYPRCTPTGRVVAQWRFQGFFSHCYDAFMTLFWSQLVWCSCVPCACSSGASLRCFCSWTWLSSIRHLVTCSVRPLRVSPKPGDCRREFNIQLCASPASRTVQLCSVSILNPAERVAWRRAAFPPRLPFARRTGWLC